MKPSLLYIAANPIFPADSGNRVHSSYIYNSLAEHFERSHLILYGWRELATKYRKNYESKFSTFRIVDRPSNLRSHNHQENSLDEWVSPRLLLEIEELCQDEPDISAVLIDYVWLSKALTLFGSKTLKIINVHDLFSDRRQLMLDACGRNDWFSLRAKDEERGLNRADLCIFISHEDASDAKNTAANISYHSLTSSTQTLGIRPKTAKEISKPIRRIEKGGLVFGYAASSNSLNTASANHFLQNLKAQLGSRIPKDYSINIYGNICNRLDDFTDIRVFKKGWLEDISPVYQESDIILAPMSHSTGMNVKVIEAIDAHSALISTRRASRGSNISSLLGNLQSLELMSSVVAGLVNSRGAVRRAITDYLTRKSIQASNINQEERLEFKNNLKDFINQWRPDKHATSQQFLQPKASSKVSVIIPAYNTEDFIKSCVNSVLKGGLEDIEVLVVDDGSSDHTFNRCIELSNIDTRIKVLKLDSNSGQATARNYALDLALSEYVYFVDSDDTIKPGSIESLYDTSKKQNLDICFIGRKQFDHPKLQQRTSCFGAWQALIKRDIIERQPRIRQPIIKSGQDGLFANMCLTRALRLGTAHNADYFYNKREDSTFSRASKDFNGIPKLVGEHIHTLREFYVTNNLFPEQAQRYLLFLHDETYLLRVKPSINNLDKDQAEALLGLLSLELHYHKASSVLKEFAHELDPGFLRLISR